MVDYNLLNEMLEAALAKETRESWNERLDGGFSDSQLIDVVSTLDVSSLYLDDKTLASDNSWIQETVIEKSENGNVPDGNNEYALAA
jgi:hypothetical protein